MRISVLGCGYLGAVHAGVMVEFGHDVVGIDVDPAKIESLAQGKALFFEPELDDVLATSLATGRLRFSTDIAAVASGETDGPVEPTLHFICVGTPPKAGENAADTQYVDSVLQALLPHLRPGDVVIGKSTVPVGTAARLTEEINAAVDGVALVWNPEFLREAFAVQDTRSPDRIVIGLPEDPALAIYAEEKMREVYAPCLEAGIPFLVMDLPTAEMVKVSANAFLATKISFINAVAEVCEASGADVVRLAEAIGYDERIGHKFLGAGLGFGGGCLPKDIRAFMARAEELGADQALTFLSDVHAINYRRRARMIDLTRQELGGDISGRKIAVLGAAFKPNSDDIRDSPALDVAAMLHEAGAEVTVTDPHALENARTAHPELNYESDIVTACQGADAVLLLTEWQQHKELDPEVVGKAVNQRIVIDGRNALNVHRWREAGWTYRALGRPGV